MLLKKSQAWLTFSTKHVLAFVKYKKGIWCAYKTFFHCSIKIPFVFVCHGFLQSQVGSELLFYQLVSMRIPAHSLDMLDPVICVAWRILKLLLKLHRATLCGERFFRSTFFVVESIQVSPHHLSFNCIFSHFRGLLKFKNFPGEHISGLTQTHSR